MTQEKLRQLYQLLTRSNESLRSALVKSYHSTDAIHSAVTKHKQLPLTQARQMLASVYQLLERSKALQQRDYQDIQAQLEAIHTLCEQRKSLQRQESA